MQEQDMPEGFCQLSSDIPEGEPYVEVHYKNPVTKEESRGWMSLKCVVECGMPKQPAQPSPEFEEKVEDAKKHFAQAGEDEINRIAGEKDKWK